MSFLKYRSAEYGFACRNGNFTFSKAVGHSLFYFILFSDCFSLALFYLAVFPCFSEMGPELWGSALGYFLGTVASLSSTS